MRPDQRVVTKMPLTEIWDDSGTLNGERIKYLDESTLRELVGSSCVQFIVAYPGLKLDWIPTEKRFEFWKTIRPQIADPAKQFINAGRTIEIRQQVDRQKPRVVSYLKTDAAYRDVDLHPDVAEFLRRFMGRKNGLLFATANGTPHLHNNIEERWLTARLRKMGLDEPGMGWHAFRRFRKTWLRGKRCQEDINIFWMGHKPITMSEIYSRLFEELDMRLAEVEAVGYGFRLPPNGCLIPMIPKNEAQIVREVAV